MEEKNKLDDVKIENNSSLYFNFFPHVLIRKFPIYKEKMQRERFTILKGVNTNNNFNYGFVTLLVDLYILLSLRDKKKK